MFRLKDRVYDVVLVKADIFIVTTLFLSLTTDV